MVGTTEVVGIDKLGLWAAASLITVCVCVCATSGHVISRTTGKLPTHPPCTSPTS